MSMPRKAYGVDVALKEQIERRTAEAIAKGCESKKRYADEHAARAAGTLHMERPGEGQQLYFYRCKHCRGCHLTRREQPAFFAVDYLEKRAYK